VTYRLLDGEHDLGEHCLIRQLGRDTMLELWRWTSWSKVSMRSFARMFAVLGRRREQVGHHGRAGLDEVQRTIVASAV